MSQGLSDEEKRFPLVRRNLKVAQVGWQTMLIGIWLESTQRSEIIYALNGNNPKASRRLLQRAGCEVGFVVATDSLCGGRVDLFWKHCTTSQPAGFMVQFTLGNLLHALSG